ncbi:hypothetical protein AOLI_G00224660 [Acnodon oligacanthus]
MSKATSSNGALLLAADVGQTCDDPNVRKGDVQLPSHLFDGQFLRGEAFSIQGRGKTTSFFFHRVGDLLDDVRGGGLRDFLKDLVRKFFQTLKSSLYALQDFQQSISVMVKRNNLRPQTAHRPENVHEWAE